MFKRKKLLITLVLIALFYQYGTSMISTIFPVFGKAPKKERLTKASNFNGKAFENLVETESMSFSKVPVVIKRYLTRKVETKPAETYKFSETNGSAAASGSTQEVYYNWLGHASTLMKCGNELILTDPVFSKSAAPFDFVGPKRFFQNPVNLNQFNSIDYCLISHDHYDHLDYKVIRELHHKVKHFIIPLGVKETFLHWGVPAEKLTELNWGESITIGNLTVTAEPTRHFSGRLFSQNNTLWNSYALNWYNHKIYFGGDSGEFDGFTSIGEKHKGFDACILAIGAYDDAWHDIHLNGPEALYANQQLQGKIMLPIHWGTFDLALHSWYEPIEQLQEDYTNYSFDLRTPAPGEWINLSTPYSSRDWWSQHKKGKL